MIWLTWRQHRKQFLFAVLALAAIVALIVPTGQRMNDSYVDSGLADCLRTMPRTEFYPPDDATARRCETLAGRFVSEFEALAPLAYLFVFLPLLVGLFFGAPLVAREVEHGTHRFVWTQGVSRTRWALAKFGTIGAAALCLAVAYGGLLTWWMTPMRRATGDRFSYIIFDLQGAAPVAYTIFAVALGIFAGSVTRRVLPAMAVTLVGFVGVRLAVSLTRSRFLPQRRREFPLTSGKEPNELLGDWILSRGVYSADDRLISRNSQVLCTGDGPSTPPDPGCLAPYGADAYNLQIYQPGDRFWPFQFMETGIFVVLAALLIAVAVHRVRRSIS